MKITSHEGQGVLESSNVGLTSAFAFANNAHLYKVMSSDLYSDKISAAIREPACNAADAHTLIGQPDLPILVHLPNRLRPVFAVKDWGPGLDDLEIREIFPIFGLSTKRADPRQTGSHGLGSKSPLAYTLDDKENPDGFTVTSVKHGVKRIYLCHLTEEGIPAVTLLSEGSADADWPHGVEISYAVRSADFGEFARKAIAVFQWFPVTPRFEGHLVDVPVPVLRFGTLECGLCDSTGGPTVVMGGVCYPIDGTELLSLSAAARLLLQSKVQLRLPGGSLLPAPNREGLSYDSFTRKVVSEALERATVHIGQSIYDLVRGEEATELAWRQKMTRSAAEIPETLQKGLVGLLTAAGVPADEASRVASALSVQQMRLPTWVGGRLLLEHYESMRGAASEAAYRDIYPEYQVTGFTRAESGSVYREQVVNGRAPSVVTKRKSGVQTAPVGFNALKPPTVLYADSPYAVQKVRELVLLMPAGWLVLLFVGTSPAAAKAAAELLCSKHGIPGLECRGTSELPVPHAIATRVRPPSRVKPFCTLTQDGLVTVLTASCEMASGQALEDLQASGQRFFLVRGRSQVEPYYCDDLAEHRWRIDGEKAAYVVNAFAEVAKHVNIIVTSVVVVESMAVLRSLKLVEKGFRPFVAFMRNVLENETHKLVWSMLRRERPHCSLPHFTLGLSLDTVSLFAAFSLRYPERWSALAAAVDNPGFSASVAERRRLSVYSRNPATVAFRDALTTLEDGAPDLGVNSEAFRPPTHVLNHELDDRYPGFDFLDQNKLFDLLRSDDDLSFMQAITLVRTALSVCPAPREPLLVPIMADELEADPLVKLLEYRKPDAEEAPPKPGRSVQARVATPQQDLFAESKDARRLRRPGEETSNDGSASSKTEELAAA